MLDTELYAPLPAGLRQRWAVGSRPGVRLLHTPGCLIRVRDTGGDGPAVVLLTDAPHTVESYDELVAALTPRVRLVVLEPPGFGFSWANDPSSLGFPGGYGRRAGRAAPTAGDRRRARRGLRVRLPRPGRGRRGPVAGPRGAARADPFLGGVGALGTKRARPARGAGHTLAGSGRLAPEPSGSPGQLVPLRRRAGCASGTLAADRPRRAGCRRVLRAGVAEPDLVGRRCQPTPARGPAGRGPVGRGRPITTARPAPAPSRSSSCCPRAGSWPCPPPVTSSTRRPSPPPPRSCYSCCPDLTWRRRQGCRAPTCRSPVDRQLGLGTGPCSESVGLGLPQGCGR